MRRRTFLSSTAALTLTANAAPPAKLEAGSIPKRPFGKTGEHLTVIGQAGGRFPLCTDDEAKAITLRAYELGINYFDCARAYWNGHSEEIYGEVLKPFRKNIFLTTKSFQRSRQAAEADLDKSLRALRTDYVDLWQIHQVGELAEVDQIFAPGGAIEAFEAAKKAGKARFIGFTGHHDPAVHLAMLQHYDKYDTIIMPLNPADPHYLSFEKQVLPIAVERGMGIQAIKSTANAGLLSVMHVKDCLNYVLSLPVHCVPLGCTTVGQIEDDARIVRNFKPLPPEEAARIRQAAIHLAGPRLENWKRNNQQANAPRHWDGDIPA